MGVVRPAAVAGTFYPGTARALRAAVDEMVRAAEVPPIDIRPAMLIVPHAGYRYSGPVAATAYRLLASATPPPRRLVLLGPSHFSDIVGLASPNADAMQTPLGLVAVTAGPTPNVHPNQAAHAREHSLEVQLPFLQCLLDAFTVLPLLTGTVDPDPAADVLDDLLGTTADFAIISSDLSHYRSYDAATEQDERTAQAIVALEPMALAWDDACGRTAVQAALLLAKRRRWSCRLLDLRNSGDTAGDRTRVVGYGAFAIGPPLATE